MGTKEDIESKAEEFAQKAALVVGESSFGGENLCDSQRKIWLDIGRRGYRKAFEEGQKDIKVSTRSSVEVSSSRLRERGR